MFPLLQPIRHLVKASSKISVSRRFFCDGENVQKAFKFGQPTEWTHPHIIQKNEINKGILKSEFRARREKLIEKLLKLKTQEKHLLLLPAAQRQYMVDKIPYFYRKLWARWNMVFNKLIVGRIRTLDIWLDASSLTTFSS